MRWSSLPGCLRLLLSGIRSIEMTYVPDDINAVIIDNVLNGSEVYGSGRRLAQAMLPISGGMCTSSFRLSSTTSYRPMLNSVDTSTPAHPLVATMPRHSRHTSTTRSLDTSGTRLSTRARRRKRCGSRGGLTVLTSYIHISYIYGYVSPHGGATVRVSR